MKTESNKIYSWMERNYQEYVDFTKINCTKLAEDCAAFFDDYEGTDYDVPFEYFDCAIKLAQEKEKNY